MAVRSDRDGLDLFDGWRVLRKRMRPAAGALPGLLAAVALLAACGTEAGSDSGNATEPSESSSSHSPGQSPSPTDTPRIDESADDPTHSSTGVHEWTGSETGQGSGEPVVLADVRVNEHEGFDRIVLEFSGTGTPGWNVSYVDKAVLDGSGKVVDLGGDSTLDIRAPNTTWPASDYYSGPQRLGGENGVPEVYVAGTFEGYTQVLAGVDDPRERLRVFTLKQPSRLVVDIIDDNDG